MPRNTINIQVALLCSLVIALTTGCGRQVVSPEAWFSGNKATILKLNRQLLECPEIRRVEADTPLQDLRQYGKFDEAAHRVYKEAIDACVALGIDSIEIARTSSKSNRELISVKYILMSRGLSVSGGEYQGVEFIPDPEVLTKLRRKEEAFCALGEAGWYAVAYREGSNWGLEKSGGK